MSFHYQNGVLHAEALPLTQLAERFGTPCYVYSKQALVGAYQAYITALSRHCATLSPQICYSVKANSNLSILGVFAALGSGFDIVSGGELLRVLKAGGTPEKIVFSGVGKSAAEIRMALEHDVHTFNVESASELRRIATIAAEMGKRARISLRVNPDVDPKTHPYISTGLKQNKFGVSHTEALAIYREAAATASLEVVGIDCHIGSQITELLPYRDALARLFELVDILAAEGIVLEHVDLGGGVGIRYRDEATIDLDSFAATVAEAWQGRPQTLIIEPGRSLVGAAGLLLTRIEYLKPGTERNFAITDAAMNDLMRPALYDAYHDIVTVMQSPEASAMEYEIVGPICESSDFLGHGRQLAVQEGDLLAIRSAGAYGMSMSSNYNTRPRAAEVLVDGSDATLIRRREALADLFSAELPTS